MPGKGHRHGLQLGHCAQLLPFCNENTQDSHRWRAHAAWGLSHGTHSQRLVKKARTVPCESSGHAAHSVSRLSVMGFSGAVHTIVRLHKRPVHDEEQAFADQHRINKRVRWQQQGTR